MRVWRRRRLDFGEARAASMYYVAKLGNDANNAGITTPFKTIAVADDVCIVRQGTYRETVRPARSGSSAAPITFQAYPGETVTIDGADPITGWTKYRGSIYRANISWATEQVFVDGDMMTDPAGRIRASTPFIQRRMRGGHRPNASALRDRDSPP